MKFAILMIFVSIVGIIFSTYNAIDDYKDYKDNKEQYLRIVKYFPADYITNILWETTRLYNKSYILWTAASISWFICLLVNTIIIFI